MALQTSGPISLNDIHVEAGGSSGTSASINDSDIRALIAKASGATMSFSEWYGASGYLDSQTVTVGEYITQYVKWYGYSSISPVIGSIDDGTSNIYGGADIQYIRNLNNTTTFFSLLGSHSNSGWTTMDINGNLFTRASATYSNDDTLTSWTWSQTASPFPAAGEQVVVTWI